MKKPGQLILIAIIAIIFIPGAITIVLGNNQVLNSYDSISKDEEKSEEESLSEEQLIGIVAKEIPITYSEEALKVQVIMARSYIASTKKEDISYMSADELKQLWGSDYNKNHEKIQKAVEDTENIIMTYKKEPVQPVYHVQSVGVTQSPLDVWDLDVPYLESVESSWDETAPDLINEKEYSAEEISSSVNKKYNTTVLEPYHLETQIQIIERAEGGYVRAIQVGNELMSGEEFRKLLDLKSSCFMMQYSDNKVAIVTKGAGHGVGLSQYGANKMSEEGKGYKAILKHYFPKAEVGKQK